MEALKNIKTTVVGAILIVVGAIVVAIGQPVAGGAIVTTGVGFILAKDATPPKTDG